MKSSTTNSSSFRPSHSPTPKPAQNELVAKANELAKVGAAPDVRTNPPNYLSVLEAAAYLGISPRNLALRVKEGAVPCIRFGRRRLFRRAQLDAAMENLETSGLRR